MEREGYTVRQATIDDAQTIATCGSLFFRETFDVVYTEEELKGFDDRNFTRDIQTKELKDGNIKYYLLFGNTDLTKCIGYLKLEKANPDGIINVPLPSNPLNLARLYECGKGLGGLLMNKAKEEAKNGKHDMLWLGVWPDNKRAIRLYEKSGFIIIGEHEFHIGDKVDIDFIMAIINFGN